VYLNLSLGNILEEEFSDVFKRMRKLLPHPVGGLCPVYEVCDDIKKARLDQGGLPLNRELSEPILEKISRRPLPEIFRKLEGE